MVETTAPILHVSRGKGLHVSIKTPRRWKLKKGESVNVDGICSTVVSATARSFSVAYVPTTLRKTTAKHFAAMRSVNLERSLMYGTRVSGHFVLGHVDGAARVLRKTSAGSFPILTMTLPSSLSRFVVPRGSVAISGVSLTVAKKGARGFSVALIPYTTAHTTLGKLTAGDVVNIEVDVLARYGHGRVGRRWRK